MQPAPTSLHVLAAAQPVGAVGAVGARSYAAADPVLAGAAATSAAGNAAGANANRSVAWAAAATALFALLPQPAPSGLQTLPAASCLRAGRGTARCNTSQTASTATAAAAAHRSGLCLWATGAKFWEFLFLFNI